MHESPWRVTAHREERVVEIPVSLQREARQVGVRKAPEFPSVEINNDVFGPYFIHNGNFLGSLTMRKIKHKIEMGAEAVIREEKRETRGHNTPQFRNPGNEITYTHVNCLDQRISKQQFKIHLNTTVYPLCALCGPYIQIFVLLMTLTKSYKSLFKGEIVQKEQSTITLKPSASEPNELCTLPGTSPHAGDRL